MEHTYPLLDKQRSLVDQYFEYQTRYSRIYGEKTIVIMEVGSFMEMYGVDNEEEKVNNLAEVCYILNIQLSRRNKAILDNSRANPQMAGFTTPSFQKYTEMLVEADYTVVVIEQVSPPPEPDRRLTRILSPSTYIDSSRNRGNILMGLLLDEARNGDFKVAKAVIDLATGKVSIGEAFFSNRERDLLRQQILHWLDQDQPREVLWMGEHSEFLDVYSGPRQIRKRDPNSEKITYQNAFFHKWFPEHGHMIPVEYLGLEMYPDMAKILIYSLQFAYEHDLKLIERIQTPTYLSNGLYMQIYNEGLRQLQVFPSGKRGNLIGHSASGRMTNLTCVQDVIDNCQTAMGRRMIRDRIAHPVWRHDVLQRRWDRTEAWVRKTHEERMDRVRQLRSIKDLEKLFRRIQIGQLTYSEMISWIQSLDVVFQIITDFDDVKEVFETQRRKVDLERAGQCSNTRLVPFFTDQISPEWAELLQEEITTFNEMEEMIRDWERRLQSQSKKKKDVEEIWIHREIQMDREDAVVYTLTPKRASNLMTLLENPEIRVEKYNTATYWINAPEIVERSRRWKRAFLELERQTPALYAQWMRDWHTIEDRVNRMIIMVGDQDVVLNSAIMAHKWGYTRPVIESREGSFVSAKKLRHPLVERFELGEPYVPHDVAFGKGESNQGVILTGLNSAGKTVLMKSIGIAVLMAQAGFYVPAESFKFCPFKSFFTRISGEDNLLASRSSFAVEMIELRSILEHANEWSLLIGDELCRGTEQESALSIVASSIQWWIKHNIPFITATHLYPLFHLEGFRPDQWGSKRLQVCHLWVEIQRETGKLVYHRQLKPGLGESLYGLEVAQHLISKPEWSDIANKYRIEILKRATGEKSPEEVISVRPTRHNPMMVVDRCNRCGSREGLEVHHKDEQANFGKGKKEMMNDLRNLEVLCRTCHIRHHQANPL